jgi:hypothetical protein
MRGLLLAQAERGEATDPEPRRGEGFVYTPYWRGIVALHRVDAWVPLEVSYDAEPAKDGTMPLPVPDDRDVPPDARWAALVAVHDLCRVPEERIGPAGPWSYECLIALAAHQTADLIPTLRAWLASVTTPDPHHRPDRQAPPPKPATKFMTTRELAAQLGVPRERWSAVEKALRDYATSHTDCRDEIKEPRRGEERVVYRTDEVWPFLLSRLPGWLAGG